MLSRPPDLIGPSENGQRSNGETDDGLNRLGAFDGDDVIAENLTETIEPVGSHEGLNGRRRRTLE